MTDHTDKSATSPGQLGYAIDRDDAWPVLARARKAAEDARSAYETIREQVVYAALREEATVREIAEGYDIPKSEVGRLGRRVRDLPARSGAGGGRGDLLATHRRAELLNELWNGPDADPVPGAPQAVAHEAVAARLAPRDTPSTALDAVESRINFVDPPGHVCETSIRLAPDDDRVIWILTAYDERTVVGVFAAMPDEEEGIVQGAVQDQARVVYAITALRDPELIARTEQINLDIANEVDREMAERAR